MTLKCCLMPVSFTCVDLMCFQEDEIILVCTPLVLCWTRLATGSVECIVSPAFGDV